MSDIDSERDYACVGTAGRWEISVLSQFSWKPKAALKNEQLINTHKKK